LVSGLCVGIVEASPNAALKPEMSLEFSVRLPLSSSSKEKRPVFGEKPALLEML
jgi:hypothetical protein